MSKYSEPAFPSPARTICDTETEGMTLHQYFAGQALSAHILSRTIITAACIVNSDNAELIKDVFGKEFNVGAITTDCLDQADAMLAEYERREKEEKK